MEYEKERKAWAVSAVSGSSLSGNAYLALVDSTGSFKNLGRGPCHGSFSKGSYVGAGVKTLYSFRQPLQDCVKALSKKFNLDLEEIYYNWLLNKSPWAEAFLEKDYAQAVKYGFAIRTDLPNDYIASACIATRFLTEKYAGNSTWVINRIEVFADLLDKKLPVLWAFVMAQMYQKSQTGKYSYSMPSGHEMVPPNWTLGHLKNFVTGNYFKTSKSFSDNSGYSTVGTAWASATKDTPQTNLLAKIWQVNFVEKINNNIFEPLDKGGGYPVLELEALLDVQKQIERSLEDV